jgi:hypothetical protein
MAMTRHRSGFWRRQLPSELVRLASNPGIARIDSFFEPHRTRAGFPIRKATMPVAVEVGVAGGVLPLGAGTSFQGKRCFQATGSA